MSTDEPTHIVPLFTLPSELLIEILQELDYLSLLNCRETCSTLHNLVETTTSLQCMIQMGSLGLEASHNTLTPMDVMKRLGERRRRWDALDWSSFSTQKITGTCEAYELVGGVFAQSDGCNISFQWLPSSTSYGRRIDHKVPIPVRDFAMDPSQDLLVILEQNNIYGSSEEPNTLHIHLLTMTTHLPHEKAVSPLLTFPIAPESAPYGNGVVDAALYILDDLLSVSIRIGAWSGNRFRFLIFNWTTNAIVYDSDQSDLAHGIEGFELLTDNIFVMTSHDDVGSLLIHSFGCEASKLLCGLKLPTLSTGSALTTSIIYHDPCVARHIPSDDQPFKPVLDESLLILSLTYHLGHDDCSYCHVSNVEYTMVIPIRILLQYAKEILILDVLESTPAGKWYEWEDWGPQSTRLLHPCIPKGWLRFSSGQQIALSDFSDDVSNQPLQILDFSRHPKPNGSTDDTTIFRIGRDAPTHILQPSPFEEDVMTCLPYHRHLRSSLKPCKLFMLDAHRILGITLENDGTAPSTKLHVYTF